MERPTDVLDDQEIEPTDQAIADRDDMLVQAARLLSAAHPGDLWTDWLMRVQRLLSDTFLERVFDSAGHPLPYQPVKRIKRLSLELLKEAGRPETGPPEDGPD